MTGDGGNLVPIGRFSAICRLTIKALRHYDDLGLLKPALTDPHSGYRYYSLRQAEAADLIRTLRATEMPLEEIKMLLAESDPDAARAHLLRHQERIKARIATQQDALALLDRLITPQEAPVRYDITLEEQTPQPIVSTTVVVPPSELDKTIPRSINAVRRNLQERGLQPSGAPFAIYHEGTPGDDQMTVEVGWPVGEPQPGVGAFAGRTLPSSLVAQTLHLGPYSTISRAYAALTAWMQEHGHETAGPPREEYVDDPKEVADPAQLHTAVSWPVR